jgi:hypothetical protein
MHANICWQLIACIVCKEINLWLRSGWCGLEDGLLLLLVVDAVVTAIGDLSSSSWIGSWLLALFLLGQLLVARLLLPDQGLLHLALFFSFYDSIH